MTQNYHLEFMGKNADGCQDCVGPRSNRKIMWAMDMKHISNLDLFNSQKNLILLIKMFYINHYIQNIIILMYNHPRNINKIFYILLFLY